MDGRCPLLFTFFCVVTARGVITNTSTRPPWGAFPPLSLIEYTKSGGKRWFHSYVNNAKSLDPWLYLITGYSLGIGMAVKCKKTAPLHYT